MAKDRKSKEQPSVRAVHRWEGDQLVRELWVEVPHGDWLAAYRFLPVDGRPVLAEVRVFPAESVPRDPGRWSEQAVPEGGVPARVLRELRTSVADEVRRHVLQQLAGKRGAAWILDSFGLQRMGFTEAILDAPHRPGRRGRDEAFYASIAVRYAVLVATGTRTPIQDLAKELVGQGEWFSPESVRQLVTKARARGLLTEAPPGRAGGVATERAWELVKTERRKTRKRRQR